MGRWLIWVAALFALAACEDDETDEGPAPVENEASAIFVLGDSLMDFNGTGQDIGDVVAAELGRELIDAARGGTTMFHAQDGLIPQQYRDGAYTVLLGSGGGNDLLYCTCGEDCGEIVDQLITADGTGGVIIELIEQAIADGARVAWIGYMVPQASAAAFAGCTGEQQVLIERLRVADGRLDGMVFIDSTGIGTGVEEALYAEDGYHPSPQGSATIGRAVAERLRSEFGL